MVFDYVFIFFIYTFTAAISFFELVIGVTTERIHVPDDTGKYLYDT